MPCSCLLWGHRGQGFPTFTTDSDLSVIRKCSKPKHLLTSQGVRCSCFSDNFCGTNGQGNGMVMLGSAVSKGIHSVTCEQSRNPILPCPRKVSNTVNFILTRDISKRKFIDSSTRISVDSPNLKIAMIMKSGHHAPAIITDFSHKFTKLAALVPAMTECNSQATLCLSCWSTGPIKATA